MTKNATFWTAGSILITGGIGLADFATGGEIGFFVFYLIPVALASWFAGRWPGVAVGIAAALVWLAAEVQVGRNYSNPVVPYWNMANRLLIFGAAAIVLSRLQSSLLRERLQSRTDPLTLLPNRASFYESANHEMARARRTNSPITVAYIDLDRFKELNDKRGHAEGDRALRDLADSMRRSIRDSDLIARLGGDEFVLLFPDTGAEGAKAICGSLLASLKTAMEASRWPITFSVGLVTWRIPPDSVEILIQKADDRMYEAKRRGRNRVETDVQPSS